jgi:hypothetical protein
MILRLMLIAAFISITPAFAFDSSKLGQMGSLPLTDIKTLIAKTPKLQSEINAALAAAKKKMDDVICDGMRFPGPWDNLGGERVAPYTCEIGSKWLVINSTVRVTGPKGKVFQTITPEAMKQADKVTETNLKWRWTTEDPNKDQ